MATTRLEEMLADDPSARSQMDGGDCSHGSWLPPHVRFVRIVVHEGSNASSPVGGWFEMSTCKRCGTWLTSVWKDASE